MSIKMDDLDGDLYWENECLQSGQFWRQTLIHLHLLLKFASGSYLFVEP